MLTLKITAAAGKSSADAPLVMPLYYLMSLSVYSHQSLSYPS